MTISKAISTMSLAGALVAAAVALSPSDAAAGGFRSQTVVTAVVGGSGHAAKQKQKPKPAKPRMRECKASDRCRG